MGRRFSPFTAPINWYYGRLNPLNTRKEPASVPIFRNIVLVTLLFTGVLITSSDASADSDDDMHAGPAMNYHRIDERLVTGGRLVDGGLAELKTEGVTVVIDLRDEPPAGQKEKMAQQGIEWFNVPIEWDDPEAVDFERFSEIMQAHQGDHVMVQCAANYRASAMTYLYRVVVEQVDENQAEKDLYAVWTPVEENQQWADYIEGIKAAE